MAVPLSRVGRMSYVLRLAPWLPARPPPLPRVHYARLSLCPLQRLATIPSQPPPPPTPPLKALAALAAILGVASCQPEANDAALLAAVRNGNVKAVNEVGTNITRGLKRRLWWLIMQERQAMQAMQASDSSKKCSRMEAVRVELLR